MRVKKLMAAMLAVLALGALAVAGNASAAIGTEASQWYSGTTAAGVSAVSGAQTIKAKMGTTAGIGTVFKLTANIGGTPLEFTATGLECVGCIIANEAVTGKTEPVATGKGTIKFTGVTVMTPTGCTVRNGEGGTIGVVETKPLTVHADFMHEGKAFQQWFPTTNSTFATLFIEGGGCIAIKGPYQVTGTLFSEAVNLTGTMAQEQAIKFSSAIQTTTGAALKLGANAAELTGTGIFEVPNAKEPTKKEFFGIQ
jgi:hypothetical protein